MARKKLPPELKAKSHTFRLYDWEVEKVKEYIKCVRANKQFYSAGRLKDELRTI